MKLKINNKYFKWGLTAFFVIVACICFYYLTFHISNVIRNIKSLFGIVMPVVFGLVIAYLLTPILNSLEKRMLEPVCDFLKIKKCERRRKVIRAIAVLLTSVLVICLFYILIAMIVSQIVPSIQAIVNNFDGYVNELSVWLNKLLEDNQELKSFVIPQVNKISVELETWLADTATLLAKSSEVLKTVSLSILSFLKVAWNFIIGFVISIYVLASKETFAAQSKKIVYAVLETNSANAFLKSMRFVHRTFIGFISGKVLDSIIIGILCFIGTSIMHTPYAVLVSVIVGVTNVIPFFGPYLGAIPSALLILIVDLSHPMNCVYFVLFILVLQQVDGNIIGPKILGESTGLSGFWVIFSITVFGGLFGVPGMIVGVPIFAVIFSAVKEFVNRSLQKKKMPIDSNMYCNVDCVDENGNFLEEVEEKPSKVLGGKKKHAFKVPVQFRKIPFLKKENAAQKMDSSSDSPEEEKESKENINNTQ